MKRDNFNDRYERSRGFIGNIKREYADIARQAAKDTEFPIDIIEEAADVTGHSLPSDVSVWTYTPGRDHGPFWKRYAELKQEATQ